MFPTSFAFAAALFALPLAAAPVLLHLLYRQKSPVVMFSTLRFVKLSVRQTAARRKVQKWLLLACRALLVGLLIWAIAQPARQLAASWAGGRSVAAAIVIDTSYSMQLHDGGQSLAQKADGIAQDLLRNQLADAKVAVFRATSDAGHPETLQDASAVLATWTPAGPRVAAKPLADRVAAAREFLDGQTADGKWLVVISDFQSSEFGHPLGDFPGGRTILFDLHPAETRSDGIVDVAVSDPRPIPGTPVDVTAAVVGRPGDTRVVSLEVATTDGQSVVAPTPVQVTTDSQGQATARWSVRLPPTRWMKLTAAFTDSDEMPWDDARTTLVEVPPRQTVGFIASGSSAADRFVASALNPWSPGDTAGKDWPLAVRPEAAPSPGDDSAVAVLTDWPDAKTAGALRAFAAAGHGVVLFLSPGMESRWASLPADVKGPMAEMLPSPPTRPTAGPWHVQPADPADPLLSGLTAESYQLSSVPVRQLVPLSAQGKAKVVLNAVPSDPATGAKIQGLLFRKPVGRGTCYTVATIPDGRATGLGTHPTFLPLLVDMTLPGPGQATAQNAELNSSLSITHEGSQTLDLETPSHEHIQVTGAGGVFSADANAAGLYVWRSGSTPVGMASVGLPAGESVLTYRPAGGVAPAGRNVVVASSTADLNEKVSQLTTPRPQWTGPLAVVLLLLCVEALMGSVTQLWRRPAAAAA